MLQISTPARNGWNPCLGYGRINAYAALLEAAKKSLDSDATSANGGRRIVRDSNGDYHMVFSSSGDVLYRRYSTDWEAASVLSPGDDNNFPTTTPRSSNIYVAWQKKNGSNHDIYFHKSTNNGTDWPTSNLRTFGKLSQSV